MPARCFIRLEGIVRADVRRVEYDEQTGRFEEEVRWHDSYEAEQHVHHYGKSSTPVCWSLVGYSSGFASACLGKEIYFREMTCAGQGERHCSAIGRDADSWGAEGESIRADFQAASLGHEVERLREAVGKRLKELDRRERLLERRERELNLLRERVNRHAAAKHFVAGSEAMQHVLELAARVAPLDTTVLVYGESGTGKEFVVRLIHDQSPRAAAPFVSINCAALTETLLESELFGHVRGAFTGAVRDKAGLFEVAGNGTIFLDEIGEVAPTVQAKLLALCRSARSGASAASATSRSTRASSPRRIAICVRPSMPARSVKICTSGSAPSSSTVPPLRERREDIPPLVHSFLVRAAARMKKDVRAVSADAMSALMNYRWPGNVRELEHAIERAVILANAASIRLRDLPPEVTQKSRRAPATTLSTCRNRSARPSSARWNDSAATGAKPPRRSTSAPSRSGGR